jgi:hypothetical protein
VSEHLRLPLVLAAGREVLDEAARLLPPGASLEERTRRAILDGALTAGSGIVQLRKEQVIVRVVRTRSPLTGRKCWRPVAVTRAGS